MKSVCLSAVYATTLVRWGLDFRGWILRDKTAPATRECLFASADRGSATSARGRRGESCARSTLDAPEP